jgi:hypothetical protein
VNEMTEKNTGESSATSFEFKAFGKALVSAEADDVISNEEYRDVKIELFATGHNLVRKIIFFFSYCNSFYLDICVDESSRNRNG